MDHNVSVSRRGFLTFLGAGALGVAAGPTLAGCARVAGTDRAQLMLISADQAAALGDQAWQEIRAQETPSRDREARAMIQRIGRRLGGVLPPGAPAFTFELFESPTVNAFALPGGKVAVYTGILAHMANEAELAAVVGHEMGHIVARHGAERMSQKMLTGALVAGGGAALELGGFDGSQKGLALAALGAGATVGVLLPYSRKHEYEADHLGAVYMAKAGYRPQAASAFWRRMSQGAGGNAMSDFLSTHPADAKRIAALEENMPTYQGYLARAADPLGEGAPIPARYR